jgi:hypothetical protein
VPDPDRIDSVADGPLIIAGHYWLVAGSWGHLIEGPCPRSGIHQQAKATCGGVFTGEAKRVLVPERACPSCLAFVRTRAGAKACLLADATVPPVDPHLLGRLEQLPSRTQVDEVVRACVARYEHLGVHRDQIPAHVERVLQRTHADTKAR